MAVSQEILGVGVGIGAPTNAVAAASSGVLAVTTALKAFTKVPEGERGVRTHFGRATRKGRPGELYGIVEPGIHPVFPFTHSILNISVQDQTNALPEIQIESADDEQLRVESSIIWAVRADEDHPYRALFRVNNSAELTQTVTNLCAAGLYRVLDGKHRETIKDHKHVSDNVNETCRDDLLTYGVELKKVNLQTVTPTLGEMLVRAGRGQTLAILAAAAAAANLHSEDSEFNSTEAGSALQVAS